MLVQHKRPSFAGVYAQRQYVCALLLPFLCQPHQHRVDGLAGPVVVPHSEVHGVFAEEVRALRLCKQLQLPLTKHFCGFLAVHHGPVNERVVYGVDHLDGLLEAQRLRHLVSVIYLCHELIADTSLELNGGALFECRRDIGWHFHSEGEAVQPRLQREIVRHRAPLLHQFPAGSHGHADAVVFLDFLTELLQLRLADFCERGAVAHAGAR
mmetsp:Transcript_28014/g.70337  ORF Transcript_28014/g.70337 Transcript_28014/m.70337 type:complete len:210 (-) Transcript_28014:127-756(-)